MLFSTPSLIPSSAKLYRLRERLLLKNIKMEESKKVESLLLSKEAIPHFEQGISLVLSNWWALQMAIENGWGGRNTRALALDFSTCIFNFFQNPRRKEHVDIYELEDLLDDHIVTRFCTHVDDGSIEEVAEKLMVMYEDCLEGDYDSINKLKHVKPPPVTLVKQDASDSGEDEDEGEETMEIDEASNMMVDSPETLLDTNCAPPQQQNGGKHQDMVEAEDGWTVVHSRKNRGRRN